MNRFEFENFNINSMANSNEIMNFSGVGSPYYFRVTDERSENSSPIPLVIEEISDSNHIVLLDNVNDMYSSIVDDINNIYKEYPSEIESLVGMPMGFENPDDCTSSNKQKSISKEVTEERNDNIDALMIEDSNNVNTVSIVKVTTNKQEVKTENINDCEEDNIIIISDDEDANAMQLETSQAISIVNLNPGKQEVRTESMNNEEQDDTIIISDNEDEQLETEPVPLIHITSKHEIRSAKNIKKILPKFKSKVQANLEFLQLRKYNYVVRSIDGYRLLAKDLFILITPRAWLTDVIILNYFSILVEHCQQVLLLDPDTLEVSIQKGVVPKQYQDKLDNPNKYNKIIVPINPNGNHWAFLVLEIWEGKIYNIDSYTRVHWKELALAHQFLTLVRINYAGMKMTMPNNWTYVNGHSPIQSNTDDCGVFACTNARYYLFNKQPDFTQRDVPLLRHRIAWELINDTMIPF